MKTIPLTQGKFALVDDEDFEWLNQFKWCAKREDAAFYAVRTVNQKMIRRHRLILDAPKGAEVDHKNGNGLDNRKENIRLATHQQNLFNRRKRQTAGSRFLGVNWQDGKWRVRIMFCGRHLSLGMFDDEKAAARAYNAKALECFGEFAKLNALV